jgi:hypothetical protein
MKNRNITFFAVVAMTLAALISGCAAAPQAAKGGGFPVIDIVDGNISIADDSQFANVEQKWERSGNTKIIGGTFNSPIIAKDVVIHLTDTSFQIPIKNGEDLTEWFLNIPNGLTATAHALDPESKNAAEKGSTEVLVTIQGIPTQTINQPIKVRIPYEKTNRGWDFLIPINEDLRFEVYGADVANIIIGGAVNREIDSKTFKIKFGGAQLSDIMIEATDISSWFTNLPRGLTAVVTEDTLPNTEGQQSLTVTVSGRPTVQSNERIKITIPRDVTTANMELIIPPTDYAIYDIGSYNATSGSDVELRFGTNWKGEEEGWRLTGPQVFQRKDFSAVGIIQVTAQAEYKIGADGEFHWTGDTITYGQFMAEARRLNAHAIIDVVIDKDDVVDVTIELRHVEAGHIPSAIEALKIKNGLIEVEEDPNGGILYRESIEVTRRTYTGTALAITYAPAYNPTIGDGSGGIYIPSFPLNSDSHSSTVK